MKCHITVITVNGQDKNFILELAPHEIIQMHNSLLEIKRGEGLKFDATYFNPDHVVSVQIREIEE